MRYRCVYTLILVLSFVVTGCGGTDGSSELEASNTGIQEIVERSLRAHADSLDSSLSFVADSRTYGDGARQLGGRVRVCTKPGLRPTERNFGDLVCKGRHDPLEITARNDVEGLLEELAGRFFVERNVASSKGDTVVYDLHGATVCNAVPDDACSEDVRESDISIRAKVTGEQKVRARLEIGPKPYQPAVVRISPERISATLRLASLRGALEYVSQATGTELVLPETMKGVTTLVAQRAGGGTMEFRWRVDEAIEVVDPAYGLALEPADPALRARVERSADRGLLEVAMQGASFSWEALTEPDVGTYSLEADALGGTVVVKDADPALELRDIHLGDTGRLSADGTTVSSLRLEQETGDAFSASVSWSDRQLDIRVEPTFDVGLDMKFKAIADRLEEYAEWTYDSSTQLRLEGADAVEGRLVDAEGRTDYFEMTKGSAVIEATGSATFRHKLGGGQCLVGRNRAGSGHPLEDYSARSCQ